MNPIPLGIYRHYKGNLYEAIGFARHSETLEDMVNVLSKDGQPAGDETHAHRQSSGGGGYYNNTRAHATA